MKHADLADTSELAPVADIDDSVTMPDRKFVAAIGRAFEILSAFRPGEGALGNSELSALTRLPKPTVTRLTHTLTRLGYLVHSDSSGKYEPTPSILALGYCVLSNIRLRQLAGDYMEQLAEHTGATVGLASRDRLNMIYVATRTGCRVRAMTLDIGSRVAMETTALGRAFLAGISTDERNYFFGHFARTLGDAWPAMKASIETSMGEIRDRGFCLVDGEWQRDILAVAAPIVAPDGETVLAMNCVAATYEISREAMETEIGPRVAHLCRSFAAMMGG